MGKINVLDQQVANLIAAGEVVERPASAIKELLENSIDAGAKKITVEIKNGGVSLMRISDDGCGMTKDDAILCVRRHATSKIKDAADLDGIVTLGFRGEALAAISSVSEMRIMTRTKDSPTGIIVKCSEGKVVSVDEAGCPCGTTIIVEELFANVPARKKFLKRDASETAAVAAVVEKIALSRPDIAIKFITDGELRFNTAGNGKLIDVIYAVLGRDQAKKMAKIYDMTEGIEVDGYIGTPENCRGNRNYENFFINGRYVKCQTAAAALEQAFSSYIPSDKFPCCVLMLTIHPAFVDVNVHPQKMEVKFSNEKPVFNAVYCAVRNALMNKIARPRLSPDSEPIKLTGDSYRLYNDIIGIKTSTDDEAKKIADDRASLDLKYSQIVLDSASREPLTDTVPEKTARPASVPVGERPTDTPAVKPQDPYADKFTERPRPIQDTGTEQAGNFVGAGREIDWSKGGTALKEDILGGSARRTAETKADAEKPSVPWFRIAGVAFNCYVFVELDGKMLVIDKHAAHERILFENLRANMKKVEPSSQLLLFPVMLRVTYAEFAAAHEYKDELLKIGYDFVDADKPNTLALLQRPLPLDENKATEMFSDILSKLASGTGDVSVTRDTVYEKALYQASCKAAVKGGRDDTTEKDLEWLVTQVLTRNDVRYCPHGRPVAFEMTEAQFEKLFERT